MNTTARGSVSFMAQYGGQTVATFMHIYKSTE